MQQRWNNHMEERALIVFAKFPRAGEVKTRLGKEIGMDEATAVYREFAAHAFGLARQLQSDGVEIFVFYAPDASTSVIRSWVGHPFRYMPQAGNNLGERMRNAFDETFRLGSKMSVIIGTDVPELDVMTLRQSYSRLSSTDMVIGPSTDGGYYLLGMNAGTKDVFSGIEWSTGNVLSQTLDSIGRLHLSHFLLPAFADVDTAGDFFAYMKRKNKSQH